MTDAPDALILKPRSPFLRLLSLLIGLVLLAVPLMIAAYFTQSLWRPYFQPAPVAVQEPAVEAAPPAEEAVETVPAETPAEPAPEATATPSLWPMLWELRRRMETGEPFRYELVAVKQRLVAQQAHSTLALLPPLEAQARKGIPPYDQLRDRFEAQQFSWHKALGDLHDPKAATPGPLARFFSRWVSVRATDPARAESAGELSLLSIRTALQNRVWDKAVQEGDTLAGQWRAQAEAPSAALNDYLDWLSRLHARHEAESAVEAVADHLMEQGR